MICEIIMTKIKINNARESLCVQQDPKARKKCRSLSFTVMLIDGNDAFFACNIAAVHVLAAAVVFLQNVCLFFYISHYLLIRDCGISSSTAHAFAPCMRAHCRVALSATEHDFHE